VRLVDNILKEYDGILLLQVYLSAPIFCLRAQIIIIQTFFSFCSFNTSFVAGVFFVRVSSKRAHTHRERERTYICGSQ